MDMLEVKNYSFKHGDNKILDNISFTLESGKILGLVGPSGVGKTSLIRRIVGLYKYMQR